MSRTLLTLIGLFALAFAPRASAQDIPKMGVYLGLGLDLAVDEFDDFESGTDFDPGVGFVVTLGYRFHPNIAIEGVCEFLDHMDSDDFDPDLDVSILSFNANVKGYLSTARFQPFILLGAGVTRFRFEQDTLQDNDVGVTGHFGGGADYYVAPRISVGVTAAYVVTSGKIKDLNHSTIGIGAQYRF